MLGVLNVLYENDPAETRQYYRALSRNARAEGFTHRLFTIDNSAKSLASLVPEESTYRHFPTNIGYTRALNLLTEEALDAGCDIILSTNLDGFLLPGCVSSLLATFHQYDDNALVGAREFPHEHRKVYDRETGRTNWLVGSCLLTGRKSIELLGSLDEAFFMYSEDVDHGFRASAAGIPSVVSEGALFFHRRVPPMRDPVKLRYQCTSGRHFAAKWRLPQLQRQWEDRAVACGFVGSRDELPPLPEIESYPCPIPWDTPDGMICARQRWVP